MQFVVTRMGPLNASNSSRWWCHEAPVVSDEVRVLLQRRIGVRGQHLAVGVDVDPGVLRLLEQLREVLEIVAGHQDPGPGPDGRLHGRDHRVTVGRGVGRIEQSERGDTDPAALEDDPDHLVDGEVLRGRGEPLLEERLDRVVRVPEHGRVVVVRADALHAVDQHLAEGADVLVPGREDADLLRLRVDVGVGPPASTSRRRARSRPSAAGRRGSRRPCRIISRIRAGSKLTLVSVAKSASARNRRASSLPAPPASRAARSRTAIPRQR